ncbi:MAG: hypothetical protein LBB44_04130 [Endomicrobium sp.]|jgi:hypothetical protein|nr:hypothetical protein [Endomicrobium sp.]
MKINEEVQRRRNILERADKLKSKGLILSERTEILSASQNLGLGGHSPLSRRAKRLSQTRNYCAENIGVKERQTLFVL